jgi:hypothetical protein
MHVATLCFVGVMAWAAAGRAAQPDAPRATPADVAAAQALFEQGRALMAKGRASDACPKFEESQHLDPALGTQFNLASCYEQLGKLASAYALFTQVAATARATGQQERDTVARARAEAVKPRLTKLAIFVPADSAKQLRVERDGVEIGEAQWGFAVPVDPGPHRVRAFGAGLGEWSLEVDIPSDGAVHQVMVPGNVEDEAGFLAPLNHKLALAAAGVGVVGLGMGSVFALRAISKKNAADDAGCRGGQCSTPHGLDLRRSARSAGDLATVGLGIGLTGVAAAAALLWLLPDLGNEHRSEEGAAALELSPFVGPGWYAVSLGARF